MNSSWADTVKCRLDAGKSPIFRSQSPCTYIYTYRSRNGFGIAYVYIFSLEITESKITRGHNVRLVKKQSRLDVRKFSFSQRTIDVWNKLSTDCVHASSVNMFKNKIDKYLVKAGYSIRAGYTTFGIL